MIALDCPAMSEAPGMSLKWDFCTLADHVGRCVREVEDELRLEQAVYGLDTRSERDLQALLAARLASAYEVAREVHYPSSRGNKLTHRMRCDLVLSPGGQPLRLDTAGDAGLFDPGHSTSARPTRGCRHLSLSWCSDRRPRLPARGARNVC